MTTPMPETHGGNDPMGAPTMHEGRRETCPAPECGPETPETAPSHCWACGHQTAAHDVDPETGYRPCRNIGHPKGVPCAECRRLITPEHIAAVMAMRESGSPGFKEAYGAFKATYEHVRDQFGDAWKAFFTDIHESAVASALIEYAPAHEAMVRAKVAEEVEPILTDLRKAARTHHYTLACEGTDAALGRLRAVLARGEQP